MRLESQTEGKAAFHQMGKKNPWFGSSRYLIVQDSGHGYR